MALGNLARIFFSGAALALVGCGAPAAKTTYGENPDIVSARPELIATVNAPKLAGW